MKIIRPRHFNGFFRKEIYLITITILISSCTVTNNLYINDPVPVSKNSYSYYGGLGMGLTPRIESVAENGEVFSSNFDRTFNLCLGGKYGFSDRFNLAGSIHFPQIVGGIGCNIQPQFSFFRKQSLFNMAINTNLGIVGSTDSIRILGDLDVKTKHAINADFGLPLSLRLGEGYRIIVTPRYSFNSFAFRKEYGSDSYKKKTLKFPAISLGVKIKRVMLESTMIYWNSKQIYVFGIAYFFGENREEPDQPIPQ